MSHTVEVTVCYLIGKQDPQKFGHLVCNSSVLIRYVTLYCYCSFSRPLLVFASGNR